MKSNVPPIPAASFTLGMFLRFLEIQSSCAGAPYATKRMFGWVLLINPVISFSFAGFGVPACVPTILTPGYFASRTLAVSSAMPSAAPNKNILFCVLEEALQISKTKSAPVTLSLRSVFFANGTVISV